MCEKIDDAANLTWSARQQDKCVDIVRKLRNCKFIKEFRQKN